jgi:hypothetical protein
LPDLVEGIEVKGHTCRWVVTDAMEPGRQGWKVVQCFLDAGDAGPAWYLATTRAVYARNAAAKIWSQVQDPPAVPAWLRPGIACSMQDYYDDCMVGIVIDHVRPKSGAVLPQLQKVADQTLSFSTGHAREVAAKVEACGVTGQEARCGQFNREMRAVADEVVRQLAVQGHR